MTMPGIRRVGSYPAERQGAADIPPFLSGGTCDCRRGSS
jgi:hypothetical protein